MDNFNINPYLPELYLSGFATYLLTSTLLYVVAKRLKHQDALVAFLPFFNLFLFFDLAGVSTVLGVIGMFIPIVNIVIVLLAWSYILKKLERSSTESLLLFIPGINIIYIGYLIIKYW